MHDDIEEIRGSTVALTAGTAVSLAPEAVRLIADLDGATSAQQVAKLRGAVRDGWIGRPAGSAGSVIATQFPDGSPRPGEFKDK